MEQHVVAGRARIVEVLIAVNALAAHPAEQYTAAAACRLVALVDVLLDSCMPTGGALLAAVLAMECLKLCIALCVVLGPCLVLLACGVLMPSHTTGHTELIAARARVEQCFAQCLPVTSEDTQHDVISVLVEYHFKLQIDQFQVDTDDSW